MATPDLSSSISTAAARRERRSCINCAWHSFLRTRGVRGHLPKQRRVEINVLSCLLQGGAISVFSAIGVLDVTVGRQPCQNVTDDGREHVLVPDGQIEQRVERR